MADEECTDCPDREPDLLGDFAATAQADPRGSTVTRWRSMIAPIGKRTGDGRRFLPDALSHRTLPLPVRWQREAGQGHGQAVVIGNMDTVRIDGEQAYAEGILFSPDPDVLPRLAEDVAEARLLLSQKALGPSVDLDDMEYSQASDPNSELAEGGVNRAPQIDVSRGRISAITLVPIAAFGEVGAGVFETFEVDAEEYAADFALDGDEDDEDDEATLTAAVRSSGWSGMPFADAGHGWDAAAASRRVREWAGDDTGKLARAFLWDDGSGNATGLKFPIADVIGGKLTIVPRALNAAMSVLGGGRGGTTLPSEDQAAMRKVIMGIESRRRGSTDAKAGAMVAAATPASPPRAWFDDPQLTELTPLTVTDDGRVFGHIADWRSCHTGFAGQCRRPPKSATNYAYFHLGQVVTAEGDELPVGKLTLGAGHADTRLGYALALEHYDNTAAGVAYVRAGEDRFGLWVSGALKPGVDEFAVTELRASPPSGDWRLVGGNLELVGVHAVNQPGFPVRRSLVAAATPGDDGAEPVVTALVAAAVGVEEAEPTGALDVRAIVAQTVREVRDQERRAVKAAELAGTLGQEFAAMVVRKRRKRQNDLIDAVYGKD